MDAPISTRQSIRPAGIILFFSAFFFRLAYGLAFFNPDFFESKLSFQFDRRALTILEGARRNYIDAWASFHVPVAGFYKMLQAAGLFEFRLPAIVVFNCLLAAVTAVLIHVMILRLAPGKHRLALFGGFAYIFYYPSVYFTLLLLSENLYTPLFMGLIFAALSDPRPRARTGLLCGLMAGVALISRPILAGFLPLWGAWLLFRHRSSLRALFFRFLPPLFAALIAILALTAWINSRHDHGNRFSIAGNGGVNFTMAWCQPVKISYLTGAGESFWFRSPSTFGTRGKTINTDIPFYKQGTYYRMGMECIRDNPFLLIKNLRHIANIFHSEFYPSFYISEWHPNLLFAWKLAAIPLLFLFMLYPFVRRRQTGEWLLGFFGLFSTLVMVYLFNPGEERYLVPCYPLFLVWGPMAGAALWENTAGVRRRLLAGVAFSALLAIVILPVFFDGLERIPSPQIRRTTVSQTRIQIEKRYRLAAEWLIRNMRPDGSFAYIIETSGEKQNEGSTLTRQLITSQSLAAAARYFGDRKIMAAHRRNLDFVLGLIQKETDFSFISEDGRSGTTFATAFALMTLIDSPDRDRYRDTIEDLGEFLIRSQREDGRFLIRYPFNRKRGPSPRIREQIRNFPVGASLLGCVALYETLGEEKYLNCARQGFRQYASQMVNEVDPTQFYWHLLAYARLALSDPNPRYRAAAGTLALKLSELQVKQGPRRRRWGHFRDKENNIINTAATGVFAEALGYAVRVFNSHRPQLARRLETSNRQALEYAIGLQFMPAKRTPQSDRVIGGIQMRPDQRYIRNDTNGHVMMGLYEFLTRSESKPEKG